MRWDIRLGGVCNCMSSSVLMRGRAGIIGHLIRLVWADHSVRLLCPLHPPFDPLRGVGTVSFASHCLLFVSPPSKHTEEL